MNTTILLLLGLVLGAAVGAILMYFKSKAELGNIQVKAEILERDNTELKQRFEKEQSAANDLRSHLAGAERDIEHLQSKLKDQLAESQALQESFQEKFENLANKILQENTQKFSEQNKESLSHILNPLKEKISDFEKKVETNSKESIDMHAALRQQILGLRELNMQMSKEAVNLTKALKGDAKKQGNWGELVLERVLEKSGLEKGREYDVQQSFQREDGSRVMPDVVIHLPDGKKMIIDSKVSLVAYEQYVNSEDDDEQARYMKLHVDSIKKHVDDLGNKNYQDLYQIESPNFVLMFIPIEPTFALAINTMINYTIKPSIKISSL
ncbi:MAG: DNA recombination protein RmuC [Chitinophagales bacterium]